MPYGLIHAAFNDIHMMFINFGSNFFVNKNVRVVSIDIKLKVLSNQV